MYFVSNVKSNTQTRNTNMNLHLLLPQSDPVSCTNTTGTESDFKAAAPKHHVLQSPALGLKVPGRSTATHWAWLGSQHQQSNRATEEFNSLILFGKQNKKYQYIWDASNLRNRKDQKMFEAS